MDSLKSNTLMRGMEFKARLVFVGIVIAVGIGGCGFMPKLDKVMPDSRKAYQKSTSLPDLEVPPDLTTEAIQDRLTIPEPGDTARYSDFQERRADKLRDDQVEKAQTAAIHLLENEHVLAVEGAIVQVWPKLQVFWRNLGYSLELDDVELGVIETAWEENDRDLERDRFKVFAEPGEETGTTILYVSHEGESLASEGEELIWQRRPRNVEYERLFVDRLQEHLTDSPVSAIAGSDDDAEPAVLPLSELEEVDPAPYSGADTEKTKIARESVSTPSITEDGGLHQAELVSVGGGKVYLTVAQEFPAAWKATGRALEKAGVDVKDSDKARGVYFVEISQKTEEQVEPKMWKKLKFWNRGNGAELQVTLTGVGEKTEVVVLNKDGRWVTGEEAEELLSMLHNALNSVRI